MTQRFLQDLEATISIYKSKYLTDLDDETDEAQLTELTSEQDIGQTSFDDIDSSSRIADESIRESDEDDDDTSSMPAKTRRRRSRLPRDLSGLMGQANLCFAQEQYKDAIIMCQEVIRLAPRCAEPFVSLAVHYGDQGEDEKAEQLYLIAAYLQPSNVDLWVRVAESATKRREFRLAATCYTKAIRADKNELSSILFHLKRCNLYEKLGDQKKALRGYENLIAALGPNDEKFGLELARGISRIYFNENKITDCIRTLEGAVEKYSNQLTCDDLSQLCRCYNSQKDFIKTIDLMVRKCSITVKLNNNEDWNIKNMTNNIERELRLPIKIEVDLSDEKLDFVNRSHLTVAFISLGYYDETVTSLIKDIQAINLVQYKDQLYQISNAYYEQGSYDKAKLILIRLTRQRDTQTAPIWLLYSQCLKNLNEIDQAIAGYRKVLSYEPDDYSSRLALSNLLSVQGRSDEALKVTSQPLFTDKPVDVSLLYQNCQLLRKAESWDQYCQSAKALLLTEMTYTGHQREIICMVTSKSQRTRLENLRSVQRELGLDTSKYRQKSCGAKLESSVLLEIFLKYIEILFHIKQDFMELKRICFSAYTCSAFECYESSIDFYTALACICSEDRDYTYNHIKLLASRNPDNNQSWNLLSLAMNNIYLDLRHGKFCLRQFMRNPEVTPLAVFNGHNALMSGSYKHALGEYMTLFKERPNDALLAFCLSVTYLSLSCQKYVSNKYLCTFQMIAFLYIYLELRGNCQESMYNIGRVFHQMNMLDKAVLFYKKALTMDSRSSIRPLQEDTNEFNEIFDLRREAAYNLALIYKNSRSPRLAHKVIKEYLTI